MRPPRLLLLAALLLLAPAAQAHTSYFTPDGANRIVVGNLGEPVYTFTKTGLDLCFQQNTTERAPVTIDPALFTAVLVAPNNETLSQPLRAQFGREGCYTFEEGYVLTQPGQYVLRLQGPLGSTQVDAAINVAGPIDDGSGITFPDKGVPSSLELAERVDRLEDRQSVLWVALALVAVLAIVAGAWLRRKGPAE